MGSIGNLSEEKIFQVLKSYLIEAKSHRSIQEEILNMDAPARGGGFVAMQILHHYGIRGDRKGILLRNSLEEEYAKAEGDYKAALEILKHHL
ncbi:hypothetical protein R0K17_02920 [Planococcus sp. SIMBA_143]